MVTGYQSPVGMVRSVGMTTPTATVQPTLLNMKQAVPVVGTVSPVRPASYQYPNMFPGYQPASQSQFSNQFTSFPYSPSYSNTSFRSTAQPDQYANTPPAGGYFLAPAPGSPSFQGGQVMTPVTTGATGQGFLCGPYNYPAPAGYTGGRVIGPIIAIGM